MKKGLLSQTRKALNGHAARSVFCRCRSAGAAEPTDGRDASNVVWVYAITTEVGTEQLSGVTGIAGGAGPGGDRSGPVRGGRHGRRHQPRG